MGPLSYHTPRAKFTPSVRMNTWTKFSVGLLGCKHLKRHVKVQQHVRGRAVWNAAYASGLPPSAIKWTLLNPKRRIVNDIWGHKCFSGTILDPLNGSPEFRCQMAVIPGRMACSSIARLIRTQHSSTDFTSRCTKDSRHAMQLLFE